MNKEQIYDSQISPLFRQIIQICKDNGIAVIASFDIGHDGEGPNGEDCSSLLCNTLLPNENGVNNPLFEAANAHIRRRGRPALMTMIATHGDGSKTLTAVI